jgi:putative PIN family toxin of toxin-antitoxin system
VRVVIDTNVLVSAAILPGSVPRRAVDTVLDNHRLLASRASLAEVTEVLFRPRFDKYLSTELRQAFLEALAAAADLIDVNESVTACRDPKDNFVLELAVSGSADCVVSGDDDLLALNPFRTIPILSPRDFVTRYGGAEAGEESA